ncbi:hypothetical protein GOP47_0018141, partial [Adiantum capillus-veneris]
MASQKSCGATLLGVLGPPGLVDSSPAIYGPTVSSCSASSPSPVLPCTTGPLAALPAIHCQMRHLQLLPVHNPGGPPTAIPNSLIPFVLNWPYTGPYHAAPSFVAGHTTPLSSSATLGPSPPRAQAHHPSLPHLMVCSPSSFNWVRPCHWLPPPHAPLPSSSPHACNNKWRSFLPDCSPNPHRKRP